MNRYKVHAETKPEPRDFIIYAETADEAYEKFRDCKIVDKGVWIELTPDKGPR